MIGRDELQGRSFLRFLRVYDGTSYVFIVDRQFSPLSVK